MPVVILFSLGPADLLTVDGAALLAGSAGVGREGVARVERLAEAALGTGAAALAALFAAPDAAYVAGCSRPRAARALLEFAGVPLRERRVEWVALPFDRAALARAPGAPWYPVIDRSRCTGCGTCREYCLFSVYGPAESAAPAAERVRVAAPLNCKSGCPACARLCPTGALLFPFCAEAELNGEVDAPQPRSPDQLAALLGDDPLRVLAERRQRKRAALLDPSKFEQAERDRITYSGVL